MKTTAKITAALLVLALAGSVSARVITVEVEGVVTHINTGGGFALDGSVIIGSEMTGFTTYDTDTANLGDSITGLYNLISISMTIGNYIFEHDLISADFPYFRVSTVDPGYDVTSPAPRFNGTIYVNGTPKTYDDITWGYTYLVLFDFLTSLDEYVPTVALPDLDSWPDLSVFDYRREFRARFFGEGSDYFNIYGEVTSLTVIPEPPKTYYVNSAEGSDNNDGLSPQTAFATIQKAIDTAFNGDTVIVADGTYTGPGNRDIDFNGKAITVRSTDPNDPNIVAATIIDCNGTKDEPHRGFIFHSEEDGNSVLAGLTITNGYANLGGGIYCYAASPSIRKCTIWHNSAAYSSGEYGHGAGIYCHSGSLQISNCIISHNSGDFIFAGGIYCVHSNLKISDSVISMNKAKYGASGGVGCSRSSMTVINCTINGNIAHGGAGGITLWESNATIADCMVSGNKGGGITASESECTIENCIIRANSGTEGGGVSAYSWPRLNVTITNCLISGNIGRGNGGGLKVVTSGSISNCTIVGNYAPIGGGLYKCDALLNNCIIWGNSPEQIVDIYDTTKINYSDIQGGWPGEGNIDADPCFVEPGYWANANDPNIIVEPDDPNAIWIEGDYYLLPNSLCIDTGDPHYLPEPNETDIDGNPRIIGDAIDMGAYETNYIEAQMKFTPQMLNCNSKGKYIKAHFVLPEGFLPEDVDVNAPAIAEPMGIESESIKVLGAGTGPVRLEIAFDREAFCYLLTDDDSLEVTVIGSLTTSRYFYATDTIKIKP